MELLVIPHHNWKKFLPNQLIKYTSVYPNLGVLILYYHVEFFEDVITKFYFLFSNLLEQLHFCLNLFLSWLILYLFDFALPISISDLI